MSGLGALAITLERHRMTSAALKHKQNLVAVIYPCDAGAGNDFTRRATSAIGSTVNQSHCAACVAECAAHTRDDSINQIPESHRLMHAAQCASPFHHTHRVDNLIDRLAFHCLYSCL
jgi:hypothetical protein